jgi:hypothetical protein
VDEGYLLELVRKAEGLIDRKVRYLLFDDFREFEALRAKAPLLLWDENGKE